MNTSLKRKVRKKPVVIHRPKKVVNIHDKSIHRSMLSHSYNATNYKMKINALLSNNKALAQALEIANMELANRATFIIELQRQLTLQSPKIFKAKLQKVCEHLHVIVGLLEEVMEECDNFKSSDPNDQIINRDKNSADKGADELNTEQLNLTSVNEAPQCGNQQIFKVMRSSEMPAIVEQPEIILDNKFHGTLNPEEQTVDISKVNIRSRSSRKSKSFPKKSSEKILASENCENANIEKSQYACIENNENVNLLESTHSNKSPIINKEFTESYVHSELKSPKVVLNKNSSIPKPKSRNKHELLINFPETSKQNAMSENSQKIQKLAKSKHISPFEKISPNKKCIKMKEKSPDKIISDRRKTFIISHNKKNLKRETFVISEINKFVNSPSNAEDSNNLNNSSPTRISSITDDKFSNLPKISENISNEKLRNENDRKIEINEDKISSFDVNERRDRDKIKRTGSLVERRKSDIILDIENKIKENSREDDHTDKEITKEKSTNYNCEKLNQMNSDNHMNLSKEFSPNVLKTRKKSIKIKNLTKNNIDIESHPKINVEIISQINCDEEIKIDNKELIVQLDDILSPMITPHSNKKEENYLFITDPLDGSFLKLDISPKLEETSNKDQNEKSQDNKEDFNNPVNDSSEREGRKRRAVVGVSYKELPCNKKLRQGDPYTSTIYDANVTEKFKKEKKKKSSVEKKKSSGTKHIKEMTKQIIDKNSSDSSNS